ncbi:type VII secretion protein EccCa [Klenkia terrae]|uniref:Type VII secretion protein EccCa n=1 Tax=Klenkia terrae TaxID=1052259 RepID=A0ABU8EET4_9ACTN|nr:type VII secretion protein EccCa [Klenkia terrae]
MLDPPPELPTEGGRKWSQMLMVLPMLAGAGAMALLFTSGRGGPLGYVAGGLFGVSALGMVAMGFMNGGGGGKKEMAGKRRSYLRHLSLQRRSAQRAAEQQRRAMLYRHPDPDQLWTTAASHRLWERRADHADFGVVRIGLGPQALATPVVPPQTGPLDELEPLSAAALRRFVLTWSAVPDLPVSMALNGFGRVHVLGPVEQQEALARAVVAQLTTHHSPDDVLVAVCAGTDRREAWEYAKWLPHAQHPERSDALGRVRLMAPTLPALEAQLDDLVAVRPRFNPSGPVTTVGGPHVLVVLDGGETAGSDHLASEGGVEGVTVLDLTTAPPRLLDRGTLVLEVTADGRLSSRTTDGEVELGRADALTGAAAESLARQLAPLRLSAGGTGEKAMTATTDLADLLGITDPFSFDVSSGWAPRPNRDQLRVPIGVGADGAPLELDLKESAQDGVGPHGLLVGATGSGKSELLRTLVLALACTHDSETLNFVLSDFKGGATFTRLDRLPHTSAVITNLADELPLVDRMTDAINGELVRRQELLRSAGNYASLRDYERARLSGVPLAPLPSLLIVCDEFSELLSAKPDFIDMFVQIGRVGRSLGVHLLLASQRLEEGRLRGLDTHLSYRIALRTNSAMESRVVLSAPDAFELPRAPGFGYVKFGTDPLERFRAAYVSGTYRRASAAPDVGTSAGPAVLAYESSYVAPALPVPTEDDDADVPDPTEVDTLGESLLDVLVDRLEGQGTPAHQVWLPPLQEPPTLDQLLPPLVTDPARGLTVDNPDLTGTLRAHVGVVDRPAEQRRDPLVLDLTSSGGHAVVVGGPQSGKSTLLRSLITSLALTHTPREVQFYCFDFGGGGLGALRRLPHVGAVAGRNDVAVVRRTIAELRGLLAAREARFAQLGTESVAAYRRGLRAGRVADDPFGDVVLVVDGWSTIRGEFEDLEPLVTDLATRGPSYGLHVVAAASRWLDLRPAVRDLFGTKVELRLGDTSDSMIDRRTATNVPTGTPGRGLEAGKAHILTALPRIDGEQSADDLAAGQADLVDRVAEAWTGPAAPGVRLLPDHVAHEQLLSDPNRGFAVGIAEDDLSTVHLDLTGDPHLVVFGDAESGKSAFLRSFARRISEQCTPQEARIVALDYRRSLLGAISPDHLLAYGTSGPTATTMVEEITGVMRTRLPGPDVTTEQLRNRSWWTGPELYLLVDDYDLVASGTPNPLAPLLEFIAQGRDVGLHLVVTRRSGGAGRALFEPVLQRLRELASPGIVLSGNREEGALVGSVRPGPQPPGRGWLVTRRGGTQLVQLAWSPPTS